MSSKYTPTHTLQLNLNTQGLIMITPCNNYNDKQLDFHNCGYAAINTKLNW